MPTFQYSQIRARNVITAKNDLGPVLGRDGGKNVVKGIPEKIVNHGLLAAVADSTNSPGEQKVWGSIIKHLQDPNIALINEDASDVCELIRHISTGKDSRQLRRITTEVMEWLNFARRLI